ncbi:hypothetical protein GCM10017687_86970 [Streptomyces echinatus]|uniref:hypothetical protein n=1 Tax=Streptomyces echinatus TaxID=67293 RepID=UPI0031F022FD
MLGVPALNLPDAHPGPFEIVLTVASLGIITTWVIIMLGHMLFVRPAARAWWPAALSI